eukprot:scaffold8663_cov164-Cylindrotheca_fusiformis.AAC.3
MTPNRSSKVPQHVDQFLLRHLVSENRFETFSFLDRSVDYYSLGISREQLKNRFDYLRRKQRTEFKSFLQLLVSNGIPCDIGELQKDFGNSSVFDDEEDEEQWTPASRGTKSKRLSSAAKRESFGRKTMAEYGAPPDSIVINVDSSRFEFNREVFVFEASNNIKGVDEKSYYSGFVILARFCLATISSKKGKQYPFLKARILTPSSVAIYLPSVPFALLDEDEFGRNLDKTGKHAHIVESIENARHVYKDQIAERGETRCFVLDFGKNVELSSKAIHSAATDDEYLPMTVLEYGDKTPLAFPGFNNSVEHWTAWWVARTDVPPVKKGRTEKEADESFASQFLNEFLYNRNIDSEMPDSNVQSHNDSSFHPNILPPATVPSRSHDVQNITSDPSTNAVLTRANEAHDETRRAIYEGEKLLGADNTMWDGRWKRKNDSDGSGRDEAVFPSKIQTLEDEDELEQSDDDL